MGREGRREGEGKTEPERDRISLQTFYSFLVLVNPYPSPPPFNMPRSYPETLRLPLYSPSQMKSETVLTKAGEPQVEEVRVMGMADRLRSTGQALHAK